MRRAARRLVIVVPGPVGWTPNPKAPKHMAPFERFAVAIRQIGIYEELVKDLRGQAVIGSPSG